jgi:shikimate dehydrogenase
MTDNQEHYAVFGNPVGHSKSPDIHRQFAEQTGQSLIYTAELIEPDQFAEAVTAFAANHGKGLNITVPFKQEAWQLATRRSHRAERAGAVNTLVIDGNQFFGDNTDGTGFVRDLVDNHNQIINNKTILIVGAGGATRGVIEPILELKPAELVIANRTVEKAWQLAEDFSELGNISGCSLEALDSQHFDIVINATSASLQGDLPDLPGTLFNENACAYDMMYAASPTPFMQWAKQNGAVHIYDGLGMLVEQAAESFRLWRNVLPETRPVIQSIRESLT